MSLRVRKTFKLFPGVRLNVSKTGVSASFGGAPLTFNVGSRGAFSTVSIPGTGISLRQRLNQNVPVSLDSPPDGRSFEPGLVDPVANTPESSATPVVQIRSASTTAMGSVGLKEFRDIVKEAIDQRGSLQEELREARDVLAQAMTRHQRWNDGFLFKRLWNAKFAERRRAAEAAAAQVTELEEQLQQTTLRTQIEVSSEQAEPYGHMRDAFAALSEARQIWDTLSTRRADSTRDRTTAHDIVTREKVHFSLGIADVIEAEAPVPHLQNRNGGDLFLYPGFVLYYEARDAFALIESRDVDLYYTQVRFTEVEPIPDDAPVVGQTWLKANKDGSPDRRFRGNSQIPIVLYGGLSFRSSGGLNEEYLISSADRVRRFVEAWKSFQAAFRSAGDVSA